ncbi:MAG TPA: FtsX-like permease family protein [Gammaproteobacteria bacterium]
MGPASLELCRHGTSRRAGAEPGVLVESFRTQVANTDRTISREILVARLSDAFAFLALVIACVGRYGTVSYRMARRTCEMGIRMALGATRSRVLRLALRHVLALGLAGVAIGLPLAMLASRSVERFLWGVSSTDPIALAGSGIAVLLAVALAGYAPARRASKVQPMTALRTE